MKRRRLSKRLKKQRQRKSAKARYMRRKLANQCVRCGLPLPPDHDNDACSGCRSRLNKYKVTWRTKRKPMKKEEPLEIVVCL